MSERLEEIEIYERELYLTTEVNDESTANIIKEINRINRQDDEEQKRLKKFERKPITLFINSPGGLCYAGLGLIDTMNKSDTPIKTEIIGIAASMAGVIFLSGHDREMNVNGTIHYHNVRSGMFGDQFDYKNEVVELKRLQKLLDKIYLDNSNLTQAQLDAWKVSKGDIMIGYNQAKRYRMIDQ